MTQAADPKRVAFLTLIRKATQLHWSQSLANTVALLTVSMKEVMIEILPSEALAMPRLVAVRHAALSDDLCDAGKMNQNL